ncbi:MAG TPA: hypothetical protein VEK11_16925 [Thermoanaerobaculia bacterium]|jgi:uncharacterized paraquat-inducible protein A|nr:hypothetical protein [Thermoanaerobaculia bacterium]
MPEPYHGPQCPHCDVTLSNSLLRTGTMTCPSCDSAFEATVFHPPEHRVTAPTLVNAGPEAGSACANHARNVAVASCQRCGLFICSLCEMNIGTGTYCPSCFDRVRSEGSLQAAPTRYRDYSTMGITAVLAGFLLSFMFLSVPFGAVGIYYAIKGRRQRRERGGSTVGPIVVLIVAILEVLGGLALIGFLIWSLVNTP